MGGQADTCYIITKKKIKVDKTYLQNGRSPHEPETVSERAHRQTRDGQAQVGHGVQGLSGVGGRLHEPAARQHRGVHRLRSHGKPGGGIDPVQQHAVHPRRGGGRRRSCTRHRADGGRLITSHCTAATSHCTTATSHCTAATSH